MKASRVKDMIDEVLSCRYFAVTGVLRDRHGPDNSVYRALKDAGYSVVAVDRESDMIDGEPAYPLLDNVPWPLDCLVIVAHPERTFETVRQAGRLHIPYIWMEPEAVSTEAVLQAQAESVEAVHSGPRILVEIARHGAA